MSYRAAPRPLPSCTAHELPTHHAYRNVRIRVPYEKYTEVLIDEGDNNMFAVMKELVQLKYSRLVYPAHERALDADRERGIHNQYSGAGGYTAWCTTLHTPGRCCRPRCHHLHR
jgi:D-mannonate dehydratase